MNAFDPRRLSVVLVVLLVALAGCSGDGGTATPAAESDEDPSTSDTTDRTPTPDTDGDSGVVNDGSSTVGEAGTAFNQGVHADAVSAAGSYTAVFNVTSAVAAGGQTTTTTLDITQRHDVDTDEAYTVWISSGEQTFEYYSPPDEDVAYAHIGGQTQEVSVDRSLYFDLLTLEDSQAGPRVTTSLQGASQSSGSTTLGPATKYVIDSTQDLADSGYSQYDSIESVEYTLWVDDDTGILGKYETDTDVTQNGEPFTVSTGFEVTDLGSTTIQPPSWAP
jgi:hypothetical protein